MSTVISMFVPALAAATSPTDATLRVADVATSATALQQAGSQDPSLEVRLRDIHTGVTIPEVRLTAYEIKPDGQIQRRGRQTTDGDGHAHFVLNGLLENRPHVFKAEPTNGLAVFSEPVTAPGQMEFAIGAVAVHVRNATTNPPTPMADARVTVFETLADGSIERRGRASTDDSGNLRLDLPGLANGRSYVLRARSPISGKHKYSQPITAAGFYTFDVGSEPLTVSVVDAMTSSAVPGARIRVREVHSDGSTRPVATGTTDDSGTAVFELDGLGQDRTFQLKVRAYNKFDRYVDGVSEPGNLEVRVGSVVVEVRDGTSPEQLPLANTRVHIRKLLPDGSSIWYRSVFTDSEGLLRIDLDGLDDGAEDSGGTAYELLARSPISNQFKHSQPITRTGYHTFMVGNPPVVAVLYNGINGQTLAGQKVTAMELMPDGNMIWRAKSTTGADGLVFFDLDGLDDGRVYHLKTRPYNAGYVYSAPIADPGVIEFPVGTSPVQLIDGDTDTPLSGVKLIAYRVDGQELRWYKKGHTDAEGRVHFDFEALSAGIPIVIRARNPFGNGDSYYSQIIREPGPVAFVIHADNTPPVDLEPPEVAITHPAEGDSLSRHHSELIGWARDNDEVELVRVAIHDPILGESMGNAELNDNGIWHYTIAPDAITVDATVTVTVTAIDGADNRSAVTRTYRVVEAPDTPRIVFLSHESGDVVSRSGFTVRGRVVTTAVTEVSLAVETSDRNTTEPKTVRVSSEDGRWAAPIWPEDIGPGDEVRIIVEAVNAAGQTGQAAIGLAIAAPDREAMHILNRLTFGPTTALQAEIADIGPEAFWQQQLAPEFIDDSALAELLAQDLPEVTNDRELTQYVLYHMLFSNRQLCEVMTHFWDNHFNTHLGKHDNVTYELRENNQFREHCLGNFRDLLHASAKSPAMLHYLDSVSSGRDNPNENYARELLELHTVGVNGGYTSHDVAELARVYSGWHMQADEFFFNAAEHDDTDKVFLNELIPGGGVEEGEGVLDLLSTHPATARFISTKLLRLFVSDEPSATLIDETAAVFLAEEGAIAPVLQHIFESADFRLPQLQRAKIKTPLEFLVSAMRGFAMELQVEKAMQRLQRLGMRLFYNPIPTGYPELGTHWINTDQLLGRIQTANSMALAMPDDNNIYTDVLALVRANDYVTAEGIVTFFLDLTHGGDYTRQEFDQALTLLDAAGAFDINADNAELQLRRLLGAVLSFPGNQYQ